MNGGENIKYKGLVIVLSLMFILSLSVVSAADISDASSDTVVSDNSDVLAVAIDGDSIQSADELIATEISVKNITTTPGSTVSIPINVQSADGISFNGTVTVSLPDGSNRVVSIVNGEGSTSFTVPEDYSSDYEYYVAYLGNTVYASSQATGVISIPPKIPLDINVGSLNAKPGDEVYIPISVIPYYGYVFNGNVTVTLPDGSSRIVEITNGAGGLNWTIPSSYLGTYEVVAVFAGNSTFETSSGSGLIIVSNEDNSHDNVHINDVNFDNKTSGNPLVVLLIVLAVLGVNIKRDN